MSKERQRYKKKEQARNSSRRTFIKLAVVSAAIVGGGILLQEAVEKGSSAENYQDLMKYYPELAGYHVKEVFDLPTGPFNTKVFNLSNAELDKEVLLEYYNFSDNLTENSFKVDYLETTISVTPNQLLGRTLIFIPQDAPRPSWQPSATAATTFTFDPYRPVTFVQMPDLTNVSNVTFGDLNSEASLRAVVEFCQSKQNANDINDRLPHPLVQEAWCNSYGFAYLSRQLGKSHSDYANSFVRASIMGFPIYIVGKKFYDNIPQVGLPVHVR